MGKTLTEKIISASAILAKSVARIFFRNAINLGLPVLICNTDVINESDALEIEFESGTVKNISNGKVIKFSKIPDVMLNILNDGGLIPYVKKHKDLVI